MVIFGEKTEKTPTKEAGRVSSDRHLSLPSSKSIPPVPPPQPCSRPSTVAFYPLPLFSVDQTDLPLQTSSPTPHSILYRSLQLWHVFLGTSRHCGSSLLLPHSRSHMPLSPNSVADHLLQPSSSHCLPLQWITQICSKLPTSSPC